MESELIQACRVADFVKVKNLLRTCEITLGKDGKSFWSILFNYLCFCYNENDNKHYEEILSIYLDRTDIIAFRLEDVIDMLFFITPKNLTLFSRFINDPRFYPNELVEHCLMKRSIFFWLFPSDSYERIKLLLDLPGLDLSRNCQEDDEIKTPAEICYDNMFSEYQTASINKLEEILYLIAAHPTFHIPEYLREKDNEIWQKVVMIWKETQKRVNE